MARHDGTTGDVGTGASTSALRGPLTVLGTLAVIGVEFVLLFGVLWFVMPMRLHPDDGTQPTGPPK